MKTTEEIRKAVDSFLDGLESYSSNFDSECDCDRYDDKGIHDKECQTVKMRKDVEDLRNKIWC
jgi:hypothetical protein